MTMTNVVNPARLAALVLTSAFLMACNDDDRHDTNVLQPTPPTQPSKIPVKRCAP